MGEVADNQTRPESAVECRVPSCHGSAGETHQRHMDLWSCTDSKYASTIHLVPVSQELASSVSQCKIIARSMGLTIVQSRRHLKSTSRST